MEAEKHTAGISLVPTNIFATVFRPFSFYLALFLHDGRLRRRSRQLDWRLALPEYFACPPHFVASAPNLPPCRHLSLPYCVVTVALLPA
jgi:hypothetical protein